MRMQRHFVPTAAVLALLTAFAACKDGDGGDPIDPPPPDEPVVLLSAGDISRCGNENDEITAKLLDQHEGTILTLGDNAYPEGGAPDLQGCYHSTWGRHLERTRPVLGNHEYFTGNADASFAYYGADRLPPGRGYYSFDYGAWHIIVLDSNYPIVDGGPGSAQLEWLKQDLAANADKQCILAAWHHPRFYQGTTTSNLRVREFWRALEEAKAELILNGHFHLYERYARMNTDGEVDNENGIRQFIVGTGGTGHDVLHPGRPGVEVRSNEAFGILKLTLDTDSYSWEFVGEPGSTFTDTGSESCR